MRTNPNKDLIRFRRLGVTSIIAVYLLIFVGGLVRSTGSGMGCPDWPKCFGQWVPPASTEELPENYKEIYSDKRKSKNQKLASMLDLVGANKLSMKIQGDKNTYSETDFNATKTWIEYVNRLIGVSIGLILIALFISSFPLLGIHNSLFTFSGLILFLTIVQGWLGSIVVSTNLLPGMITIHMLLALGIISGLIVLVFNSYDWGNIDIERNLHHYKYPLLLMLILLIPQIILGTKVRESIDILNATLGINFDELWLNKIDYSFYIHRTFSWTFLAFSAFLGYKVFKESKSSGLVYITVLIVNIVVVLEIAFGVGMYLFNIPSFLQPLHLLFGTLLFGLTLYLYLLSNRIKKNFEIA